MSLEKRITEDIGTKYGLYGSLQLYIHEISKKPPLPKEKEWELARRFKEENDEKALHELIEHNLLFVVSYAKIRKNQGTNLPLRDLISAGNEGMIKGAYRFDPERGFKFITYIVHWVRQAINEALSKESYPVKLPPGVANELYRMKNVGRDLEERFGQKSHFDELMNKAKVKPGSSKDLIYVWQHPLELDKEKFENSETSWIDSIVDRSECGDPEKIAYNNILPEDVNKALSTLTDRERFIIENYFGLNDNPPLTLQQIGIKLHLTRERVRQIKEKAILKLRTESRARYLKPYIKD